MARTGVTTTRIAVAALIGCGILARATPAACLSWARLVYGRGQGAESCPDEGAMRAAVEARLGYEPFLPSADRTIIAIVARERRSLRANVQIVDSAGLVKGLRHLEAPLDQCPELAAAMALAISIAVDPSRAQSGDVTPVAATPPPAIEALDDSPEKPAIADVKTAPRLAEPARVAPWPPPPSRAGLRVGAELTSGMGTAPALAFGLALSVGLRRGAGSLAVEGRYDLPASMSVAGGGDVRTSLLLGSLVGCAHRRALFGCAIGSAGALNGNGVDLPAPRTETGFYASAGARLGAEIPLWGRWFFRPRVDFLAALARPQLQVDGVTRWVAPPFSVVAGAGLGLQIP